MNSHMFSAFTQRAATSLSRRGSLLTLGGAALAATMASPHLAAAKKKKGKDCKKKEKQRCNNDAAACKATLAPLCTGDPTACIVLGTCCDTCSSSGFFSCLEAAQA